jgi:hypothetical protein
MQLSFVIDQHYSATHLMVESLIRATVLLKTEIKAVGQQQQSTLQRNERERAKQDQKYLCWFYFT